MNNPTNSEINDVLDRLQRTKMETVDEWQSDAAKQRLPLSNVHDTRGAPLLKTDDVLKRSYPDCVGLR